MKETIQLQLTNPCHENWHAMNPNEQGRYCQSCCKTVVDFTTMTDREIIDYIGRYADGNTCARVQDGQLDRLIQTPPERKASWKYFWSLALASLLLTYRSVAQQVKPPKAQELSLPTDKGQPGKDQVIRIGGVSASHPAVPVKYELSGRVVNEAGIPVPFVTVMLKKGGVMVAADEEGYYKTTTVTADTLALSITAAGYEPIDEVMNPKQIKSVEVLKNSVIKIAMGDYVMKPLKMGEVVVTAHSTQKLCAYVGGIGVSRKSTLYQKAKRKVAAVASLKSITTDIFKNDIKVYPNPAPAGGTFTMQFNLKQTGDYSIQFIDASGKIVAGRQLAIVAKGQTESFLGAQLPGRGMYFVRVAGRDGKIYNTKVLVQ